MEKIVEIPKDVEVKVENFRVFVKGPKGSLEKDFFSPLFQKDIKILKEGDKIVVKAEKERRKIKAMVGTIASHINNMMKGVKEGFQAKLKIVYMHFPFTVKVSGNEIIVSNFLGEKVPRKTKIVGDCKVEVKGDEIIVSGIDKEAVGLTAANLERVTKIKRKDRRVFMDGIFRVE